MLCCYLCVEFKFTVRKRDHDRICCNRNAATKCWSRWYVLYVCGYHSALRSLGCMLMLPSEKVEWSRYRPGLAQRVGRGIALLFLDHGTRRGWVVSSTPRPHFTPRKDPVPILQEAVGRRAVLDRRKISSPSGFDPDRPARSQSLYRLSYPA